MCIDVTVNRICLSHQLYKSLTTVKYELTLISDVCILAFDVVNVKSLHYDV